MIIVKGQDGKVRSTNANVALREEEIGGIKCFVPVGQLPLNEILIESNGDRFEVQMCAGDICVLHKNDLNQVKKITIFDSKYEEYWYDGRDIGYQFESLQIQESNGMGFICALDKEGNLIYYHNNSRWNKVNLKRKLEIRYIKDSGIYFVDKETREIFDAMGHSLTQLCK